MLILASASVRRKEILSMLGYEYDARVPSCDETVGDLTGSDAVAELSKRKALALPIAPGDVVIGSDTLVCYDHQKLGKPVDCEDAKRMLRFLSGKIHTVYTGVTIATSERVETFVSATDVAFYRLDEETIERYVASGECYDKAGSYAVQGKGAELIEYIHGDYFTVVGLPAGQLVRRLKTFNIYPNN